ncbi:hypothetical protein ACFS07_33180 [Undibacterium arcticum]
MKKMASRYYTKDKKMQTSPSNSNVAQLPTPDSAAKQPMVSESISKTQAFALQQSAAAMRPAAQPTAQLFVTKEVEIGTTEKAHCQSGT